MGVLLDEWQNSEMLFTIQQKYDIGAILPDFKSHVDGLNTSYVWDIGGSSFRATTIPMPSATNRRIPGITTKETHIPARTDIVYSGGAGALSNAKTLGLSMLSQNYTYLSIVEYIPRLCPVRTNAREYVTNNFAEDVYFYINPDIWKGTTDLTGFHLGESYTRAAFIAQIPENALVVDHYEIYTNKSDGTEQTLVTSYNFNSGLMCDMYIPVSYSGGSYAVGYIHSALSNTLSASYATEEGTFRAVNISRKNVSGRLLSLNSAIALNGIPGNVPVRVCSDTSRNRQPGSDMYVNSSPVAGRGSIIYGNELEWIQFFDSSGFEWSFDKNKVISANGNGLRKPTTPGQPDNPTDDTPGDGDNFNDDVIYPDISYVPSTAIYTRYWLNHSEVKNLKDFLFTETFINDVRRLWTNPAEYIIGLDYYPFEYTALEMGAGQGSIYVANINTGITAVSMLNTGTPFIYGGYVDIQPYFNSYMDYAPYTSIDIYIPYIGIRQLNVHQVMGHRLDIGYVFDFNSRQFTAMLGIDGDLILTDSELSHRGTLGRVLTQFTGMMCTQFPIGGTSANETALNVIQTSAGILTSAGAIGAGIATANPAAIIGGATGLISTLANSQNMITPNVYGSVSPMSGIFAPQQPYLIINHPIPARPAAWQSLHGNPAGYSGIVSDFTGFLQCISIDVPAVNTMTADEQTEIENLMQGGIFIE